MSESSNSERPSEITILQDPHHRRADLAMVQRALRWRWPINDMIKELSGKLIEDVLRGDVTIGGVKQEVTLRDQIAVIKVAVTADSVNQRRESSDSDAQKAAGSQVNVQVNNNLGGATMIGPDGQPVAPIPLHEVRQAALKDAAAREAMVVLAERLGGLGANGNESGSD